MSSTGWIRPGRAEEPTIESTLRPAASAAPAGLPKSRSAAVPSARRKDELIRRIGREIAGLDAAISTQVNAILHHPALQKLEGSWRGLHYLVSQVPEGARIKVRVLDVSWKELTRDLSRAIEFDQSQLFKKVYSQEYDMPGGEPFGVLIGDYEIRHQPNATTRTDDLAALRSVASVAAAAFAPFVAAAHPALLDLTEFAELELPLNLPRTFSQAEYIPWNSFREAEDARFIGLTLPRVLMRPPYRDDGGRTDGFRFREEVGGPDREKYLWGNAAYAFGAVLVRAFADSGWFAAIRGAADGLAPNLPAPSFGLDRPGVAPRPPTDAVVTDATEKEIGELGFIPLCACQDAGLAAFYGNQSVQKPAKFDRPEATANARLSSMLQYILCAARFAHYVKVMTRDKVGSFKGPAECEDYLRRWLQNYTTANDDAGPDLKARHPLREARVQVREHPDKPGSYMCVAHLRPHFQLDQLSGGVRLVTELRPAAPG
jgi:type VI secretion system protein ImpD